MDRQYIKELPSPFSRTPPPNSTSNVVIVLEHASKVFYVMPSKRVHTRHLLSLLKNKHSAQKIESLMTSLEFSSQQKLEGLERQLLDLNQDRRNLAIEQMFSIYSKLPKDYTNDTLLPIARRVKTEGEIGKISTTSLISIFVRTAAYNNADVNEIKMMMIELLLDSSATVRTSAVQILLQNSQSIYFDDEFLIEILMNLASQDNRVRQNVKLLVEQISQNEKYHQLLYDFGKNIYKMSDSKTLNSGIAVVYALQLFSQHLPTEELMSQILPVAERVLFMFY